MRVRWSLLIFKTNEIRKPEYVLRYARQLKSASIQNEWHRPAFVLRCARQLKSTLTQNKRSFQRFSETFDHFSNLWVCWNILIYLPRGLHSAFGDARYMKPHISCKWTTIFMTLLFLFCSGIRKAYMAANTANIAAEAGSIQSLALPGMKKAPARPSKL